MDKQLNDIAPASTTDVAEEKTVDAGPEIAPGAEAAPESDPVTLGGTAVSPGAAFGHAQMFAEGELEIPHFTIERHRPAPNSRACAPPCTRSTRSSAN